MRASVRDVNCAGGAGTGAPLQQPLELPRALPAPRAQFGQRRQMRGDAAVRRQIAGGDRFNGCRSASSQNIDHDP